MRILNAKLWSSWIAVAGVCLGAAQVGGSTSAKDGSATRFPDSYPSEPGRSQTGENNSSSGKLRLREGTIISDQTGYFREDGDGASFVADTGMQFGALPNLNLERVVRLLKGAEEPTSVRWSVTGQVTEFSGRNFLLVTRAVYKSASPPPVPDRVGPPAPDRLRP